MALFGREFDHHREASGGGMSRYVSPIRQHCLSCDCQTKTRTPSIFAIGKSYERLEDRLLHPRGDAGTVILDHDDAYFSEALLRIVGNLNPALVLCKSDSITK